MDMHAPLYVDLTAETLKALRALAQANGTTPAAQAGHLLSVLLDKPQPIPTARTSDRTAERSARQRLLAPVRALLAADLSIAKGWADLQARLAAHGYTLRERGGGLALYSTTTATHICKASDLGWSYSDLMRRFQDPFPNHAHEWLASRVLRAQPSRTHPPSLFPDMEDDPILIEPDE